METFLEIIQDCDNFPHCDIGNPEAFTRAIESLWLFYLPDDPNPHGFLVDSVVERVPWTTNFRLSNSPRKSVHLLKPADTDDWQQRCGEAIQELVDSTRESQAFPRLGKKTREQFPIVGARFDIGIERSAFSLFGIIGRGAHMTVYVRTEQGLKIWIPRRGATKSTYPNMLDQAVAGGVARGETPLECIAREASEEAGLSADMVREKAVSAGTVTWFNVSDERAGGEPGLMNPGILYVYDLEIGENIKFEPAEDDIESFVLMGTDDVRQALLGGEFKPSCAMVMLDFFIRHGLITAETERDYDEIAQRLHRRLPFRMSPY
ncbi:hypothetical protein VM1G_07097 [Cytospora mali]|uniref:Nudix hydrolase domain-containing protein n=1 Tax=Cytospora mali TaxID=578113 RepID=A0A194W5Y5_CYTMA|nr:hypothetical protein VM1G_07097 [Valsa mali]